MTTAHQTKTSCANRFRQYEDDGGGGGMNDDIASVTTLATTASVAICETQNSANNELENPAKQKYSHLSNEESRNFSENEDGDSDDDDQYEQAMDIFVKHFDQQQQHPQHDVNGNSSRLRERRPSLPNGTEEIELTTFSSIVMRRKQELQLKFQQSCRDHHRHNIVDDAKQAHQQQQQHLDLPIKQTKGNRPLSISSISSAASSGSSASSNSSSSSGIHSSLTRNSSLNYSQEFTRRNCSYLDSVDTLSTNSSHQQQQHDHHQQTDSNENPTKTSIVEGALKKLSISLGNRECNLAQTRAAILAAGELQRKSFSVHKSSVDEESRLSRINRSFHASLRYDKSTAYRIHLMANARAFGLGGQAKSYNLSNATSDSTSSSGYESRGVFRRYSSISRNNSSTSSDSGHCSGSTRRLLPQCQCVAYRNRPLEASAECSSSSLASTSAPNSDRGSRLNSQTPPSRTLTLSNKSATLDGAMCQRTSIHHHPDCPSFSQSSSGQRPIRASKLQQSPSSVSSYSNNSSLFRDDGFEDDLTSTTSEHSSSITSSSIASSNHQIGAYHGLRLSCAQKQLREQQTKQQIIPLANNGNQNNRHRIHQEQELPLLSVSQRVVTEIIETERSYVDDLEQIVSGYLCRLRDVLEQHQELFSNLEEIYKFNKDFLFQLEECYLNPGLIAACFVENAAKFDVYTLYCTMYPQVVSTLTELMAQPETARMLKEKQMELNQSLPLGAYLLKPVQRILKYHILFKSLIKHTTDDETVEEKDRALIGEAFSVMTNIACHINEMKKRYEHSIRVQELQSLLIGWEGPDLTALGELILEDTFKSINRQRSSRHLLLFDNVLLITKKKRDGSIHYKGHIECSNLMLIETIEGQPLVFHTVPFDNPKALCAFQAENLDKKRDWCLQMKEVIIKSFEVKIPQHVRDLLMSLTKTGTTSLPSDNNSSRKLSSSEKSGRSLRAPSYLEKKRAKQQQQLDRVGSIKMKQ